MFKESIFLKFPASSGCGDEKATFSKHDFSLHRLATTLQARIATVAQKLKAWIERLKTDQNSFYLVIYLLLTEFHNGGLEKYIFRNLNVSNYLTKAAFSLNWFSSHRFCFGFRIRFNSPSIYSYILLFIYKSIQSSQVDVFDEAKDD